MNKLQAAVFDMDGTLAGLFFVKGFKDALAKEDSTPYEIANPLFKADEMKNVISALKADGWKIGIISWLSKSGSDTYGERVAKTKEAWLKKHLGSVNFDEIKIAKYGTPKQFLADHAFGILFDDEAGNREAWRDEAYEPNQILEILKHLIKEG